MEFYRKQLQNQLDAERKLKGRIFDLTKMSFRYDNSDETIKPQIQSTNEYEFESKFSNFEQMIKNLIEIASSTTSSGTLTNTFMKFMQMYNELCLYINNVLKYKTAKQNDKNKVDFKFNLILPQLSDLVNLLNVLPDNYYQIFKNDIRKIYNNIVSKNYSVISKELINKSQFDLSKTINELETERKILYHNIKYLTDLLIYPDLNGVTLLESLQNPALQKLYDAMVNLQQYRLDNVFEGDNLKRVDINNFKKTIDYGNMIIIRITQILDASNVNYTTYDTQYKDINRQMEAEQPNPFGPRPAPGFNQEPEEGKEDEDYEVHV